jgi:antitoxin component of RelBE/YafQ-DinJ toxin-antitoxin module
MANGRNTSVVSIRLPDEVVNRLKKIVKNQRTWMTELLRPVVENYVIQEQRYSQIKVFQHSARKETLAAVKTIRESYKQMDEDEEPPDLFRTTK